MNIPENLKLNRFVYVRIPKLREEFKKHGFIATLPNAYSGDEKPSSVTRKSEKYADAAKFEAEKLAEKQ